MSRGGFWGLVTIFQVKKIIKTIFEAHFLPHFEKWSNIRWTLKLMKKNDLQHVANLQEATPNYHRQISCTRVCTLLITCCCHKIPDAEKYTANKEQWSIEELLEATVKKLQREREWREELIYRTGKDFMKRTEIEFMKDLHPIANCFTVPPHFFSQVHSFLPNDSF